MAITLKDLARESGVNTSTVSRALNGNYGVNKETREAVLAIAERLGYRPNRVARGLVTGKSHTLALIVSDIRNPFFAEVARGAEDAAMEAGCDLVLCNSDLDPDKQMRYILSLLEKRVDGILMNSVWMLSREQQNELLACGRPIVLLNRSAAKDAFCTVCADYATGGALAAEHLLELGHRRIAHLTGPRQNSTVADRAMGFVSTLQAAGVEPIVMHGKNSFVSAREMTSRLLDEHPETTAIFAANDNMAFGAIRAIYDLGKKIPDDISLVGFDNVELSSIMNPPLTTVHQPKYEMGQAAVEILLRRGVNSSAVVEHRLFGVEMIRRQSCRAVGG